MFFEILDSCHLIIIIFCILMTFQNEMWLVKPERTVQRGRVAIDWIQRENNILQSQTIQI